MFHLWPRSEEYEMVNVRNKSYMRTVVERTQENDTIAVMFQIKKSKIKREKKVQLTFLMCCRSKVL